MAFKPKSKTSFKEQIKNALMRGDIVRRDFRDDQPIELMVRDAVRALPSMRNIGYQNDAVYDRLYCDHDIVDEVIDELSKDYSIRKVHCAFSGCCQYTTYGYYIDGE